MRAFQIKALLLLAGVWVVVGAVVWIARSAKTTPESVAHYVDTHSLDGKTPAERDAILQKLAHQLNDLPYEERQQTRVNHSLDGVLKKLSPEEQGRFIDLAMPEGFKQMMDAFNKMDPEKRKAMVQKALDDLKKHNADGQRPPDDPNVRKIEELGLHAFYTEASAQTKMDLMPVIEQMQHNLRGLQ